MLTGDQQKELRAALLGLFGYRALARVVRDGLGERLENIVERSSLENVIYELIDHTERRNTTAKLTRAALAARPCARRLRRAAREIDPTLPLPSRLRCYALILAAALAGLSAALLGWLFIDPPAARYNISAAAVLVMAEGGCADVLVSQTQDVACIEIDLARYDDPQARRWLSALFMTMTPARVLYWGNPAGVGGDVFVDTTFLAGWGGPQTLIESAPAKPSPWAVAGAYLSFVRTWTDWRRGGRPEPLSTEERAALGTTASQWALVLTSLASPDASDVEHPTLPEAAVVASLVEGILRDRWSEPPAGPPSPQRTIHEVISPDTRAASSPTDRYCRVEPDDPPERAAGALTGVVEVSLDPGLVAWLTLQAAIEATSPVNQTAHALRALDWLEAPDAGWVRGEGLLRLLRRPFSPTHPHLLDARARRRAEELYIAEEKRLMARQTDEERRERALYFYSRLPVSTVMSAEGITELNRAAVPSGEREEDAIETSLVTIFDIGILWFVYPINMYVRETVLHELERVEALASTILTTPTSDRAKLLNAAYKVLRALPGFTDLEHRPARDALHRALESLPGNEVLLKRWMDEDSPRSMDGYLLQIALLARGGLVYYDILAGEPERASRSTADLLFLVRGFLRQRIHDPDLLRRFEQLAPQVYDVVDHAVLLIAAAVADRKQDEPLAAFVAAVERFDSEYVTTDDIDTDGWTLAAEIVLNDIVLVLWGPELRPEARTRLLTDARVKAKYLADHWQWRDGVGKALGMLLVGLQAPIETNAMRPSEADAFDLLLSSRPFRARAADVVTLLGKLNPESDLKARMRSEDDIRDVLLAVLLQAAKLLREEPSPKSSILEVFSTAGEQVLDDLERENVKPGKSRALLAFVVDAQRDASMTRSRRYSESVSLFENDLVWQMIDFNNAWAVGDLAAAKHFLAAAVQDCPRLADYLAYGSAQLELSLGSTKQALIHLERHIQSQRSAAHGDLGVDVAASSVVARQLVWGRLEVLLGRLMSPAFPDPFSWELGYGIQHRHARKCCPPSTASRVDCLCTGQSDEYSSEIRTRPAPTVPLLRALILKVAVHLERGDDTAADRTMGELLDVLAQESLEDRWNRHRLRDDHDVTIALYTLAAWAAARGHSMTPQALQHYAEDSRIQEPMNELLKASPPNSFGELTVPGQIGEYVKAYYSDTTTDRRHVRAALHRAISRGVLPKWSAALQQVRPGPFHPAPPQVVVDFHNFSGVTDAMLETRPCGTLLFALQNQLLAGNDESLAAILGGCPSEVSRFTYLTQFADLDRADRLPPRTEILRLWSLLRGDLLAQQVGLLAERQAANPFLNATLRLLSEPSTDGAFARELSALVFGQGHMGFGSELLVLALALDCAPEAAAIAEVRASLHRLRLDLPREEQFLRNLEAESAGPESLDAVCLAYINEHWKLPIAD